ncbi:MAG: TIGR03905 family TSCPD domain-containing protein [Defluviitaleaceae bacterium]|nr:TIGR03905 family TSCPD domain-containing protein [Defluviitaleaceae bacterium]
MQHTYNTDRVCSSRIDFTMDGDIIQGVSFTGGCDGNLKGIGLLVKGMTAEEAAKRLASIQCGQKGTSCPDQLSKALTKWMQENKK